MTCDSHEYHRPHQNMSGLNPPHNHGHNDCSTVFLCRREVEEEGGKGLKGARGRGRRLEGMNRVGRGFERAREAGGGRMGGREGPRMVREGAEE